MNCAKRGFPVRLEVPALEVKEQVDMCNRGWPLADWADHVNDLAIPIKRVDFVPNVVDNLKILSFSKITFTL